MLTGPCLYRTERLRALEKAEHTSRGVSNSKARAILWSDQPDVGAIETSINLPMARPFFDPILEYLQHSWPNIVFGVQPRYARVRMKGGSPLETTIRLKFHAEKRVRQASKVVVVNSSIYKCSR